MPEGNERILQIEKGSRVSHCVENSVWKTDYGINKYIYIYLFIYLFIAKHVHLFWNLLNRVVCYAKN